MLTRMRHKRTLRRMLQDERYTRGRTLKALRDGIGCGRVYTRELLIEIGARGTTLVGPVSGNPVEGWTLRPVATQRTMSLGEAFEGYSEGEADEFAPEADDEPTAEETAADIGTGISLAERMGNETGEDADPLPEPEATPGPEADTAGGEALGEDL